ncbi:unnamed protein product, partial [Rhizoctonia solani]
AALSVSASQIHHRPDNYKTQMTPKTPPLHRTVTPKLPQKRVSTHHKRATGKVVMGHFVNWGVYGREFYPMNIDATKLTHILYSFADVDPSTGTVKLTDLEVDEKKRYGGDSLSEDDKNLYGNFKQLYLLKQKHRSLKVLLSIGGWTYSREGHFNFITNSDARETFILTAILLLENYGLDGFDIDYEYPSNKPEAQGFAALLSELRTALDKHATEKGETNPYQITASVPAGEFNYKHLLIPQMDSSLTFWNLMAYDYAGVWPGQTITNDLANLFAPSPHAGINTDSVIKWYKGKGVTPSKLVMGMPLYGRSFAETKGIREAYNGAGAGKWEAGVYDYKNLPLSGAEVRIDKDRVSSYSYNRETKELVSHDTPEITRQKAEYINKHSLGGAMFWELSGDKKGADSLVAAAASEFKILDSTPNHLYYPKSKFNNIKNNMGAGTSSSGTTVAPSPK